MIGNSLLITAPTDEPVSLQEIRDFLELGTNTAWDTLLDTFRMAARAQLERLMGRAFVTQTYDLYLDGFPYENVIHFPHAPLAGVTLVEITDTTGATATWASSNYFLDTAREPGRLVLKYGFYWPTTILQPANAVRIRYTAGRSMNAVWEGWEPVRLAIKHLVSHWFQHREPVLAEQLSRVPFHVHALIANWRVRY